MGGMLEKRSSVKGHLSISQTSPDAKLMQEHLTATSSMRMFPTRETLFRMGMRVGTFRISPRTRSRKEAH